MLYVNRILNIIGPLFYNVILSAIAFAILISCLFNNPNDPSLNVAIGSNPSNLLGHTGSYISDFLLQMLGLAAYIIPISIFARTIYYFDRFKRFSIIGIMLIFIIICLISSLLAAITIHEKWPYSSYGGIIGTVFYAFISNFFGSWFVIGNSLLLAITIFIFIWVEFPDFKLLLKYKILNFKKILNFFRRRHKFENFQTETIKKKNIVEFFNKTKNNDSQIIDPPVITNEDANISKSIAPITKSIPFIAKTSFFRSLHIASDYKNYKLPAINLLLENKGKTFAADYNAAKIISEKLIKVLEDFSVYGKILNYSIGPIITLYEFEPIAGTKSSRVIGLCDDIARSLSAVSARISVIPGKNALGIELPNEQREIVVLKEILLSEQFQKTECALPIALGKNISGEPVIVDLTKMPHLLVAGTTGSGKSVAINVMIVSLLYALTPDECKFIMIDPKMLELSIYNGIPHLLTPVVTDPKKAVSALKWVVKEMEDRYRIMSYLNVRNFKSYNEKIEESLENDQDLRKTLNIGFDKQTGKAITETINIEKRKFPYIVVIVDEIADLMLVAGKDIEFYIQRIAQMARAAGIHIVMATQRPSVDVITGVIKANLPTRISFAVTSKIDSRTILGEQGAEQLLGNGDMLYMPSGGKITRVHGPFVSDKTIENIVEYLHSFGPPNYVDEILQQIELDATNLDEKKEDSSGDDEELYQQALTIVIKNKKVSISNIQRQLKIGYNKAANLVDRMEEEGIITEANSQGKRELIEK